MALTKEKLISRLQTQVGLSKQESRAVVERVLVGQEAVLINEVPRDSERYNEVKLEHDFVSAALAPIIKNHRAVGYIHCDRAREPLFNDSDLLHLQVIGLLIGSLMVKFELLRERKMLSHVDDASGALKYGAFVPALSRELQRAVAHQYPVVLALIHLPAFRNFLDAYGIDRAHAALADTVKILRGHLREVDLLARYSADHFVVCLSGMGAGEAQALLRTVKEEAERTVGSDTSIPVCVLVGGLVLETDAAKKKPLQDLMAFTGRALLESGDGDANAIRLVRM